MGRKGVLNPEIRKKLLNNLENGLTQTDCAIYVGIAPSTFSIWLSSGEEAKTGKYRKFLVSLGRN